MSGLLKPTLEIVSLSVPISFESRESYGDLRVRQKLKSANFLSEREREEGERVRERNISNPTFEPETKTLLFVSSLFFR